MSLLLDALKEAEARKRDAVAAAVADPGRASTFETDGALALAEDVVPGPDELAPQATHLTPQVTSPRAPTPQPAPVPPTLAPAGPAAPSRGEALLAARAGRTAAAARPAAAPPVAAHPAAGGTARKLPWLLAAVVVLAVLFAALFFYDTPGDVVPAPSMPPAAAAAPEAPAVLSPPLAVTSAEPRAAPDDRRSPPGRDRSPSPTVATSLPLASGRVEAPRVLPAVDSATVRISVSRESPPLEAAWAAMQGGDLARAEALYRRVLESEPGQVDAQLALAVIAQSRGDDDAARRGYRRVLESVPDHPRAWGGLADLAGEGDAGAVESRLRQLLAAAPSAPLHFALGNLLARQQRWDDAQVEYFAAASLAPQAPDYAFNVAVALERIGKAGAALPWYNRSLELVERGRAARFDVAAARVRVERLQASPP